MRPPPASRKRLVSGFGGREYLSSRGGLPENGQRSLQLIVLRDLVLAFDGLAERDLRHAPFKRAIDVRTCRVKHVAVNDHGVGGELPIEGLAPGGIDAEVFLDSSLSPSAMAFTPSKYCCEYGASKRRSRNSAVVIVSAGTMRSGVMAPPP